MQERERKGDYKPNNRERSAESRKAIKDITDTLSKMKTSDTEKRNQDRRGRDSSREQDNRRRNDRSFSRDRRESNERKYDSRDYTDLKTNKEHLKGTPDKAQVTDTETITETKRGIKGTQ